MNKRKAKAIAYNYFASLVDEMVNNGDWDMYSVEDARLIIHYIDMIGFELKAKAKKLEIPYKEKLK
jgi:hypothetical protein